jgi:hypothetical protein
LERLDDPPVQALRRLIGRVRLMPVPCRAAADLHLFEVKERFVLLRRLGVESLWLAHQGRDVDSSLLLEIAAITTNRLIALAEVLPDGSFSRQSFFDLMHHQVEGHREMDATWPLRTSGVQALIAAQQKLDSLERLVLEAAGEGESRQARRGAADCAVYIAFFLEAFSRRVPGGRA